MPVVTLEDVIAACVHREHILPLLHVGDVVQVRGVDRAHRRAIDEQPSIVQQLKARRALLARFHPTILALMGGVRQMAAYPELPWQDRFLSACGDVARIGVADMKRAIMLGVDPVHDRPFVAVCFGPRGPRCHGVPQVEVLYQRIARDARDAGTWRSSRCASTSLSLGARAAGHFMARGQIRDALLQQNMACLLRGHGPYRYPRWYSAPGHHVMNDVRLVSPLAAPPF